MVTSKPGILFLVVSHLLVNAAMGFAQEQGPGGQNTNQVHEDDFDEIQEELEEADVPLTALQIQELLLQDRTTDGVAYPSGTKGFGGLFAWKHQWASNSGAASVGKLQFEGNGLHLKLRQAKRGLGVFEYAGFAIYKKNHLALGVGDFGINHGFGLLRMGPGRGTYLSADSKFAIKNQGLRRWAGSSGSGAIRGGAIQWGSDDRWNALYIVGSLQNLVTAVPGLPPREHLLRFGGLIKGNPLGILLAVSGKDRGVSLSASLGGHGVQSSFEAAAWKHGADQCPAYAWAMEVGLETRNKWVVEGVVVATNGSGFFPGGKLPYVPAGNDGQGWFFRGGRTEPGKGHLLMVFGKMKHRTDTGNGQRHGTTLFDMQGRWLPKSNLEITARWRRHMRMTETWSSLYPWQAPNIAGKELRSVLTSQISFKWDPFKVRLMARNFHQDKNSTWGSRSLVTATAIWWLGKSTALQASNTTSWGDPIDLVSAISPMAGLVLPRHWGSWREETTLGLRFCWKSMRGRIGYSCRVPEQWNTEGLLASVWGEATIHW